MDGRNRAFCLVAATMFGLVALLHLLRVAAGLPVTVGDRPLPMAFSWAGIVVAGALCAWGFSAARR